MVRLTLLSDVPLFYLVQILNSREPGAALVAVKYLAPTRSLSPFRSQLGAS